MEAPNAPTQLSTLSPSRRWETVFGLLMPINALLTIDRTAIIMTAPILMRELNISLVQTTFLTSAVLWTYSLLQIPAGWAISRFGTRLMMAVALFVWSLSMLLTPLAQSFAALLVLRVALGAGQAPDWAASVASVRAMFDPTQRARANSALLGGMYLGTAIGGPLTGTIIAAANWQLAFYIYGVLGFGLALLWLVFFVEPNNSHRNLTGDSINLGFVASFKAIGRSVQFWSVGGTYFFILTIQAVILVTPLFLASKFSSDVTTIGWMFGAVSLSKYGSVLLAGVLADLVLRRTGSIWLARTPMLGIGMIASGCAATAAAFVPGVIPTLVCLCLYSLGIGFAQVALWSSVQDLTSTYTGAFTGFTTACGNFAYGTAPMLIALIVEAGYGWKVAFTMFGLAGIAGAVLCLINRPDRPIEGGALVQSEGLNS